MKYIAGDFPEITKISCDQLVWGWGNDKCAKFTEHLISAEILTEESKSSIMGKAGWGAIGAIALGPLGLLAGVLGGGRSKEICVACEFDDGRKFIATASPSEHRDLMKFAFNNQKLKRSVITPTASFCIQCGTLRPSASKFCSQCGNRF